MPSSILVVELHPEQVLDVALGHVVDDVFVVEQRRLLRGRPGRLPHGHRRPVHLQRGRRVWLRLAHALGALVLLGELRDVVGLGALVPEKKIFCTLNILYMYVH